MLSGEELDAMFSLHEDPASKNLFELGEGDIETDKNFYNGWSGDKLRQWYEPDGMLFQMFQAMNMVLLDCPPNDDDEAVLAPICLHVRYDSEPIVQKAAELYHSCGKPSPQIWLGGNEGESRGQTEKFVVWEGITAWTKMLVEAGVAQENICMAGPVYNTPDEHKEFIGLAKENGWSAIHLVGAPYHMVRIALGAVAHMQRANHWVKMYFHAPKVSSWTDPVKGAQGIVYGDGERWNQLPEEFVRIPEYQIKEVPDLCTFDELIGYIRHGRDSIIDGQLTVPLV